MGLALYVDQEAVGCQGASAWTTQAEMKACLCVMNKLNPGQHQELHVQVSFGCFFGCPCAISASSLCASRRPEEIV